MSRILYILCAIVVLGIIVMVHELGHFIMGRLCGIYIKEFSVGFGPRICGFMGKETKYSLRAIPLGGYCAFLGEDEENDDPRAFNSQSAWKRFLTVFSGPLMNFVMALVCTTAFYLLFGAVQVEVLPNVAELTEGMPAAEAGFQEGDIILSVNGTEITYDYDGVTTMQSVITQSAQEDTEKAILFTVEREGETLEIPCTVQESDGRYLIGITMQYQETTIRLGFAQSVKSACSYMGQTVVMMLDFLKDLVTTGEGIEDTAGAIYIVDTIATSIQTGFDQVLSLIVVISLNLGVINLLPLPALDGGRLVFILLEMIRRKPIQRKYEGIIHGIGLILLLILSVIVCGRDIWRIFFNG